ncbi:MAG: class I mannose-6-phosphate isomerase [Clostridia bacterium]|nr:class I mannose-6-phosphate isomerase [Clostridia bacterium]
MIADRIDLTRPVRLIPSRAWRTYRGGALIDRLHGKEAPDGHFPEEWLLSVVQARNPGREGVVEGPSRVAGTELFLSDLIRLSPAAVLGEAHLKKCGPVPGVLVKFLDAAERLTVQVHPTRETALRLFGSPFGKTECWHILSVRQGGEEPAVYAGFQKGVTRALWEDLFRRQDTAGMLAALHRFPVKPGDTVLIRGGVPHAIGAGCFLAEIQEPTDYTVRVERTTPSGLAVADEACHQGLGFEKMFEVFEYGGADRETARAACMVPPVTERGEGFTRLRAVGKPATALFALERTEVFAPAFFPGGVFSGLAILSGAGRIAGERVSPGSHFLLPAACPGFTAEPEGEDPLVFLRFFGPEV